MDPAYSEELSAFVKKAVSYISTGQDVVLEFLDDYKVRLSLSKAYETFLREEGVTTIIDYGYLRNALVVDYISARIRDAGYRYGVLMSRDGYVANFDDSREKFTLNIPAADETHSFAACTLQYEGAQNMVMLHSMKYLANDFAWYYRYADGTTRTPYIGVDGWNKAAYDSLVSYSKEHSVTAIAAKLYGVYVIDEEKAQAVNSLKAENIDTITVSNHKIVSTDSGAKLGNVYDGFSIRK